MRGYDDWKTTDPGLEGPEPELIYLENASGADLEVWFSERGWDEEDGAAGRIGQVHEPMRFALCVLRMIVSDKSYPKPVPILADEAFVRYAAACCAFSEPAHSGAAWVEYAKECIRAITGDDDPFICERWPEEVEYDGPDNIKDLD